MRNNIATILTILSALCCLTTGTARAGEITDWNAIMLQVATSATPPTPAPVMLRVAAIVQSAVFDAVNGIERRYTHIHVAPDAPRGASERAAAVQAAYVILSKVYSSQQATLDAKRLTSLAGISSGAAAEHSESIGRGIAWGQSVADKIWAWRQTDGFNTLPSPYVGTLPGQWRPTPPANAAVLRCSPFAKGPRATVRSALGRVLLHLGIARLLDRLAIVPSGLRGQSKRGEIQRPRHDTLSVRSDC
jgi:hypothetical protein